MCQRKRVLSHARTKCSSGVSGKMGLGLCQRKGPCDMSSGRDIVVCYGNRVVYTMHM